MQDGTLNYAEYNVRIGVSEATVKRRLGELKKRRFHYQGWQQQNRSLGTTSLGFFVAREKEGRNAAVRKMLTEC